MKLILYMKSSDPSTSVYRVRDRHYDVRFVIREDMLRCLRMLLMLDGYNFTDASGFLGSYPSAESLYPPSVAYPDHISMHLYSRGHKS